VKLLDSAHSPEEILNHPRHQAAQQAIVSLIGQLRAVETVNEGYEFQQTLLGLRLAVEDERSAFKKQISRIKNRKLPDAGGPQPQSGQDSGDFRTWQLEYDVRERIARQYMSVGDALAWRVFGFKRRHILAGSRNDPLGPLAGKTGLAAELAVIERAWKDDGQFVLMHDLTTCGSAMSPCSPMAAGARSKSRRTRKGASLVHGPAG